MATGATTNLNLVTVQAGDRLPETVAKTNFEVIDSYIAATEMTNKSGAQVTAGDVLVVDTTANSSFTTTTTANVNKVVGIAQETIANAAAGIVKHYGTSAVKVNATTARGDWLVTSTSAGQAAPVTSAEPPDGAFAIALSTTSGAGTVTAILLATAANGLAVGATTPAANNTVAGTAGTGANAARDDHSHPGTYLSNLGTALTKTSTTFETPTGFSFSALASANYWVEIVMPLTFTDVGGLKAQFTGPSSPTRVRVDAWGQRTEVTGDASTSVSAVQSIGSATAFSASIFDLAAGSSDGNLLAGTYVIKAYISNGANAGTVEFQIAQNSAAGSSVLAVGATFKVERV